jgi:PAS domain S-box-containing protein
MMLAAASGILILETGKLSSPFLILWIFIGLFAWVYELWGFLPILIASSIFAANIYIDNKFANGSIVIVLLSCLLPLLVSAAVWHSKSNRDEIDDDNKAYRNLANELNEVANKSEVVINAIGDGVVAIDNQGIIQLINPAAQTIIGWGKRDALSLNYKSVIHLVNQKGEPLNNSTDPIQQVLNNNQQVRTNDLSLITNSDKKIIISLVISPVGELGSGVIAVFRDITKEKTEEREQAEFISTASHEMRTPVASIEGYLGLALNPQTAQIDDRAREFIQKAHAAADHLGHLFQDLLDVTKADDGRLSNNPQLLDVMEFAHEIVQGFEQKATNKGLQLLFKPIPKDDKMERHIAPVYKVYLDNNHIREIISNMVENAIKYTPTGEVVVDVTGDDSRVIVSVRDSGIGIPAEDMPHLFQKFYRVDNKDTREIGGTGLGLYICRRMAEVMGGRIWAESIHTKGSTFYVELPRISNEEAMRIAEQESQKNKQRTDNDPPATNPTSMASVPTPTSPSTPESSDSVNNPVTHNVPRSSSLTPDQIAAYVAKQRALAAEQKIIEAVQNPLSKVTVPTPQTPAPAPSAPVISTPISTVPAPAPIASKSIPPTPEQPKDAAKSSIISIDQIEFTSIKPQNTDVKPSLSSQQQPPAAPQPQPNIRPKTISIPVREG